MDGLTGLGDPTGLCCSLVLMVPDLQPKYCKWDAQYVGSGATCLLKGHCADPDAQGTETKNVLSADLRPTTHQRNPVGVQGAQSHLGDKLGTGEKQEVEVEEVSELAEQHLERGAGGVSIL